jgi:NADPH:quinone reductase-like Zn-dependent oxidoreductase
MSQPWHVFASIKGNGMKAIMQDKYGSPDVLQFMEMDKPGIEDDEVLIRVRAASVNAADWHFMRGLPFIARLSIGPLRPKTKVRGRDAAGEVEAVGKDVTSLRPGDSVFAEVDAGSFAEYTHASEDLAGLKPANLTFEQAAAIPLAGVTALQGLRDKGQVQSGQRVLIYGASGGVGTFAVQLAKSFGADVTAVCSTKKVDMVRSIGADRVIDYTQEDFTRNGQRYDILFDLVGNRSLSDCRRALTPKGTLVLSGGEGGRWLGSVRHLIKALLLAPFVSQKLSAFLAKTKQADLMVLKELIEAGKVTPVIDRTYPLSEVAEAMRYLEGGHVRGKVVVTVT